MNRAWFALLAAAALPLAGCRAAAGPPSAAAAKPFKVALLTPGKVSDSGWNALAYHGLQAVAAKDGAQVANQESTGTHIKDDMRAYAQQGYALVFGHGFEYNAPAMEVAKAFPNTVFVSSSGGQTAKNVGAFRFYLEEGFYLAGRMAGEMTKTNVVAEVGGVANIPSIESTFKAFDAGVRSVNPKATIRKVYAGSFDDVAAAKRATESVIAEGADFVIHQANDAAQGVFNAAAEHHVWAFGANADQNDNPSGAVIASAVIVADPAFLDVADKVKAGTYVGSITSYGMKDGAISFVISPKYAAQVPAKVRDDLHATEAAIVSGKLDVPKDKF